MGTRSGNLLWKNNKSGGTMRRLHVLISGLLAVLLCLLSINPTTASADGDYLVKGAILRTYTAAGGAYVVGSPFELEHKVTISGVNGFSQRFDNSIAGVSTVVWNRLGGGWAVTPKSTSPKLAKIANERDALAASGLRQGVVFRSGEVHPASTADKLNLSGLLRGGVLIDLRTTGTKDPNLPGVTEARYAMTSTTNTSTFVTKQADRTALGKALTAIANSNGPALIHCHLGRDRTGWLVSVLLMVGGVDLGTIRKEYLRTPDTSVSKLNKGVVAMYDRYDGVEGYVMDGLGLTQATYDRLAAKLAA